jgi:amino-acid N-acetyltransferase
MNSDLAFPIMLSGIRPGEEAEVIDLIENAGLTVQDLNTEKLVHFIVARVGNAIVGTVGLEPVGDGALLRSLTVLEGYRNRTVATRLIEAIEKYARAHGVGAVYLLTLTAAGFFTKQGYHLVDRHTAPAAMQATQEFRTLCPDEAQCLSKNL